MIIIVYWIELELYKVGEWCVYICIFVVGFS